MIAMGVAAIIALTSLADGVFMDVKSAVAQVQGVIVFQKNPYGPLFSKIDESYIQKIERIAGVKKVHPVIIKPAREIDGKPFAYNAKSIVRLIGSKFENSQDKITVIRAEIIEGRGLKASDKGKVVIGTEVKDQYNKFVGNKIKINGKAFEIVGVYRSGSKYLNRGILLQLDDMRELINFPKNKVAQLNVELENPDEANKIAKLIQFKLGDKFKVINSTQFAKSLANILSDLRLFVLAVASLAAIIAAIGILNTMLMSVMERYKEIGTLKATGWTNANIMQMILYESTFIGIIGGILGILFGTAISKLVSLQIGMPTFVSAELLSESFLFALVIGVGAGLYPAWKASRFDPVEALRAE